MAYSKSDYYTECVSDAAAEIGLSLTHEQAKYIGEAVENYAENVGMAFYQPPASERYNHMEREWEAKYKALQKEFDAYRDDAERLLKLRYANAEARMFQLASMARLYDTMGVSIGFNSETLNANI